MPECANCGSFVTQSFARVFGDNDDRVQGCISCRSEQELDRGLAAFTRPEWEDAVTRL